MNQYPVLFLSLKDVDGTNFNNAFELLKFVLAQCCENHDYLLVVTEWKEFRMPSWGVLKKTGRIFPK